jgi:GTP-binding protein
LAGALNAFPVARSPSIRCSAARSRRYCSGPQAQALPPTFVLFTSGKLEASYLRFIERRLREEFGFVETLLHRARHRQKKRR